MWPLFTIGDFSILSVYQVSWYDLTDRRQLRCKLISLTEIPGQDITMTGDDGILGTIRLAPYLMPPRFLSADSLMIRQWAAESSSLVLMWEAAEPIPADLADLAWVLPDDEVQLGS